MGLVTLLRRPWLVGVVLVVVVLLLNANCLHGDFLFWDDSLLITDNPRVQPATAHDLFRVFDPSDALGGLHLEFLPLRDLAYATLFFLCGLRPLPFHLTQVVMHAAVCVLFFWVARRWIGDRGAWLAAFLFAVHPMHVESVAWMAALKDPFFTACTLVSLGLYDRARDAGTVRRRALLFAGAVLANAVALGFKQIAVVIPALLLLIELVFPPRSPWRTRIVRLVPFAVVTVAIVSLYIVVGGRNHVIIAPPGGTRWTGFLTMTTVYARYLLKFVVPVSLSARYVIMPITSVTDWRFLLSALVIVALTITAFRFRKVSLLPLFVLAWFSITMAPVMNIIPIPIEMADRYVYLPSIGLTIGAGAALDALWSRVGRNVAAGLAVAYLGIVTWWGALTVADNEHWQDDVALWSSVLEITPGFYPGHNQLGIASLRKGNPVVAEREFRAAIALNPNDASSHLNLGMVLRGARRFPEANEELRRATTSEDAQTRSKAFNNLGAVAMDQGQWAEAQSDFEQSLAARPDYATAKQNLAYVRFRLGDVDGAVRSMREAVDLRPADRGLMLDWLKLLRATGRAELALPYQERLERFFDADPEIWHADADLLASAHLPEAASAELHAARLHP